MDRTIMWLILLLAVCISAEVVRSFPHVNSLDYKPDRKQSLKQQAVRDFTGGSNGTISNLTSEYVPVCQGVFWTKHATENVTSPFESTTHELRNKLGSLRVVDLSEGCGSMQNRLITYEDGSRACARYRVNTDQIQGEIFSYYLSRLLNIPGVPPAVLTRANAERDPRWTLVARQLESAQWHPDTLLVITPYMDSLEPSYIPHELQTSTKSLSPKTLATSRSSTPDLVQWSDLILFDYLTGNVDRVVNNMFNLQWNPDMMSAPAHNLMHHQDTDSLVILDNESGLLHSYRILDNYATYHDDLLKSVCLFRKETASAIQDMHSSGRTARELRKLLASEEPLAEHLPNLPAKHAAILDKRVAKVIGQINACKEMYGGM